MRKSHAVLLASVALCVSFAPLPLTTDTFAFPSINHQVIHAAAVSPHQTASATPKLPVAVERIADTGSDSTAAGLSASSLVVGSVGWFRGLRKARQTVQSHRPERG
jgi:hypothetical protein